MKLVTTTLAAAENNWLRLKRFVIALIILLLNIYIKKCLNCNFNIAIFISLL